MAALLNRAWGLSCWPAAQRFAAALSNPGGVQRARLKNLLATHARTAFGRAHNVSGLMSVDEYRNQVPIRDWPAFAPWIDRIQRGEHQVLTADSVIRLVPTGGSTGGCKLIPWTRGLAREFSASIAPWVADLQRRHPRVMNGPAYWSISPQVMDAHGTQSPGGIPIGFADDSAYLGGLLSPLVRAAFAVPAAVGGLSDVSTFRYVTVRCLLACADLRLISVWHPSFLALLLDTALAERERLLRDVREGGCSLPLPDGLIAALRPWLVPAPRRAAELAAADWNDPRQMWPELALVSCWADAAAALPAAALGRRLHGVPLQPKGLLATEAIMSFPWAGRQVAAVTGPVLEFIGEDGRARWLDEVDDGAEYEVVLTTAGGLWRYRIGDRIRIDGFIGRVPCLRFTGRAGATCDLVGEKLDDGFVAACMAATVTKAGFALLAPNGDGSPGYTLFVDREDAGDDALRLDHALEANPLWRHARRIGQLAPIRGRRVGHDAAAIWMSHRRASCLGAVKPAALDADRGWAERFRSAEATCAR